MGSAYRRTSDQACYAEAGSRLEKKKIISDGHGKSARVRKEKAVLAWEIAERERKILEELDYEEGYSLYVGIPFCPSVCSYCSFSSGPLDRWKEK